MKWIDHTKATGTGEPLPDSHPLSKGALIGFRRSLADELREEAAASLRAIRRINVEEADERRAFEQMNYGRQHGGGLHGGKYIGCEKKK